MPSTGFGVLQDGNKAEGKSSPLLPDEAKLQLTQSLKRREGRGLLRGTQSKRNPAFLLRLNDSYQQPTR